MNFEKSVVKLEAALNRKAALYSVKLSNVGNPDYRQDETRPLPETTCGWAHVDTLAECSDLCRLYISFYDLGGGNWSGGQIMRNDGLMVGRVSYNGRIWDNARIEADRKELEAYKKELELCAS